MDTKKISKGFWAVLDWFGLLEKPRGIMYVIYKRDTNKITSYDWVNQKIALFSGLYSDELFKKMAECCGKHLLKTFIYIWDDTEKICLAYHEPIENYLDNPALLKTGQGFPRTRNGNDIQLGDRCRLRCKCCGQYLPEEK